MQKPQSGTSAYGADCGTCRRLGATSQHCTAEAVRIESTYHIARKQASEAARWATEVLGCCCCGWGRATRGCGLGLWAVAHLEVGVGDPLRSSQLRCSLHLVG
jgi:hypothetical protein